MGATGEQCLLGFVSFRLRIAHPKALSSLVLLLVGEPLNNSAVLDVKEIALIPCEQVNVEACCGIKRRQ